DQFTFAFSVGIHNLEKIIEVVAMVTILLYTLDTHCSERFSLTITHVKRRLPNRLHARAGLLTHVLTPRKQELHFPGSARFVYFRQADQPGGFTNNDIRFVLCGSAIKF